MKQMINRVEFDNSKIRQGLKFNDFNTCLGKIDQIVGMTVEASGLSCNIGDVCNISIDHGEKTVPAEVVGFKNNKVLLMPYYDIDGIGSNSTFFCVIVILVFPSPDSYLNTVCGMEK